MQSPLSPNGNIVSNEMTSRPIIYSAKRSSREYGNETRVTVPSYFSLGDRNSQSHVLSSGKSWVLFQRWKRTKRIIHAMTSCPVIKKKLFLVEISNAMRNYEFLDPKFSSRVDKFPCKSNSCIFNAHKLSNAVSLEHDVASGLISEELGRG